MSIRPANYAKLTSEQVTILAKYHEEGMKSTTCSEQIERAAAESLLPVDKVKKWIGNKNISLRKRQLSDLRVPDESMDTPPKIPKPPTGLRGSSGYNLFCSSFFQSDDIKGIHDLATKNKKASEKWGNLASTEQQEWMERAKARKKEHFTLDETSKKKLVEQHVKLIAKEFAYLESLGCDASCLLLNGDKELAVLGSSQGQQFLHSEVGMICKFKSYFDVHDDEVYTHEDVRMLFNKKYSEARGVVGARVPYLAGGFHVEGFPENIRLKKPRQYGTNEIKTIMSRKDLIKFVIDTNEEQSASATEECHQLLLQVFGTRDFPDGKISKDRVCSIPPGNLANVVAVERLMAICKILFMEDALVQLHAKLDNFIANANGLILPVYCNDKEDNFFWLFYFPGTLSNLQAKGPKEKLVGHWLDTGSTEASYYLLNEKVNIIGENVIKDDQNPLFVVHQFTDQNQCFQLDCNFQSKIVHVLSKQGFI